MKRAALILSIVVMLAAIAPVAGVAVAIQEDNTPTPETADEEQEKQTEQEENTVVEEVDEDIRVTDYGFEEGNGTGTFWVDLEHVGDTDDRSLVTITEVISADAGSSGTFGIEQVRVRPDETLRVEIDVSPDGNQHGVMITTSKSINNGEGSFLQVVEDRRGIFSGAATWMIVRVAGGGALLGSIGGVLMGAWVLVANKQEDETEADLEPDTTFWGRFKDD